MYDIIIKNGVLMDGLGSKPRKSDLAVSEGRIALIKDNLFIEDDRSGSAQKVQKAHNIHKAQKIIDAKGLLVCPGFIDVHSHSDFTLLYDKFSLSKLTQGVTTEIVGNCGLSFGPTTRKSQKFFAEFLAENFMLFDVNEIKWDWFSLEDYSASMAKSGLISNIGTLVGHRALRISAMGLRKGLPSKKELDIMKDLLEKAMQEGAFGLSIGFPYIPDNFADKDTLVELCKIVNKYSGIFAVHLKSQADNLVKAIEDVVEISKKSGVKLHISHLKTAGKKNWGKARDIIRLIGKYRQQGLNITFDVYPYDFSGGWLIDLIPPKARASENIKKALSNKKYRDSLLKLMRPGRIMGNEWESPLRNAGLENIMILMVKNKKYKHYEGKRLDELIKNKDNLTDLFKLILDNPLGIKVVFFTMHENDIIEFMKADHNCIASDGRAVSPKKYKDKPVHPRYYSTFPRFFQYFIKSKNIMPIEEAVRKCTSNPADFFGIKNRGVLKKGYFADIIIFSPDAIKDCSTLEDPHRLSTGIKYILLNGKLVIEDGKYNDQLAGSFLAKI